VIDWLNKIGKLQVCAIEGWKLKVQGLLKLFQYIRFQHIYRTHNIEAKILSKKSFMEPEGSVSTGSHLWIVAGISPIPISLYVTVNSFKRWSNGCSINIISL